MQAPRNLLSRSLAATSSAAQNSTPRIAAAIRSASVAVVYLREH